MIKYVRYKEVSLYWGSFPSILLLLGLGISFVISRTSLYGCSLNGRSTVPVQNCGRFARRRSLGLTSNRSWQTTLYNMVNLLLRDVILVNLGFHMCRTRAVTVFPCLFLFFSLKERQILIGRIDLAWANCYRANRPSGETTWYPCSHCTRENGDIFLRFGLPSTVTRIRWKRSPKTHLFKNALQSGDFWKYRFAVHDSKSQREDVDFFEKGEKNIRFQTKTDACRRDPTSRHD